MSRAPRAAFGGLFFLGGALCVSSARADLGQDVARLTANWSERGTLRRLRPRLGERGTPSVIYLPNELLSGAASSCVSVAVLGTNSTHFTLRAVGNSYLPDSVEDWPQASLAGLVQITRCGTRKSRLAALLLEMHSPRGVIEVVAVESSEPVQPAVEVLPQRNPGPITPLPGLAPPIPAVALTERLALAEASARRAGANDVARDSALTSARGTGHVRRQLEAGCHRLQVLTEPGSPEDSTGDLALMPELDATASLVSIERGDGFDAALTLCAGEPGSVGFRFAGAPPNAKLWVVVSRSELPAGLPQAWGAGGRARMAAVLMQHGASVRELPIDQAIGVQGPTLMPIAVEPGACYTAALSAVQGQAFSLALGARVGGTESQNHSRLGGDGTLISFCARGESVALVEADSRGAGLTWLFALWQTGRLPVGEEISR